MTIHEHQQLHFTVIAGLSALVLMIATFSGCGSSTPMAPVQSQPSPQLIGLSIDPPNAQATEPDGTIPFSVTANFSQSGPAS